MLSPFYLRIEHGMKTIMWERFDRQRTSDKLYRLHFRTNHLKQNQKRVKRMPIFVIEMSI